MKKYIIRRTLKKVEAREIEVENWDEAVKELEKFMDKKIPENHVLIESLCNAEFIGEA